ncbi:AAA family ATPase [Burkholderia territorii]|uniref:AAA family ATPase n=1 Tax=Burkholderia territorii TaxID=1503055 RepID=UPI001E5C88F3|nr:AAA family ATPase [Burkholderia territorii]
MWLGYGGLASLNVIATAYTRLTKQQHGGAMLLARIVEWIETQQTWLSDAARRLVENGRIDADELEDILAMTKASVGIPDPRGRQARPLTRDMVPADAAPARFPTLVAMQNLVGVNAIAPGQRVPFASEGLTVIYGDNGSGKSGYSRVLRKACRARETGGPILGNVFDGRAALGGAAGPSAEIEVAEAGTAEPKTLVWHQGQRAPAELAGVAVFDSLCATAFNDGEGEIAYTPRGLDVLSGLAALCRTLRERLDAEIAAITVSPAAFEDLTGDHPVGRLLGQFQRRFDEPLYRRNLDALAALSDDERSETERLTIQLAESNPGERAAQLRRLKARVDALTVLWERCEGDLATAKVEAAKTLGTSGAEADAAAKKAGNEFAAVGDLLSGTGSGPWRLLFEAARKFSVEAAYVGHAFPHVDGSRCVLCQQDLDGDAVARMVRFEQFVQQEAQRRADELRKRADEAFAAIARSQPEVLAADVALLEEVEQAHAGMAARMRAASEALSSRKALAVAAWAAKKFDNAVPVCESLVEPLKSVSTGLVQSAVQFDALALGEARKRSEQRLSELRVRHQLAARLAQIIQIADALTLKKKLEDARRVADSGPISRRMQTLHAEAVSGDVETAFARECEALRVGHLPIQNHTRIDRGSAKQRLKLDTVGREKVGDVLSEGEQKALALATFLAEVSLVPGHGAVILDDPMSSLDHERRERVAKRLGIEALTRQVIVFTHDLAFANHLVDAATEAQAPVLAMSLRRTRAGAGVVYPELPFAGARIGERLDRIRQMAAQAARAEAEGDHELFETRIRQAYGRLRETWERIVEEAVLNKTIVRFRPVVATQSLRSVELSDDDYTTIHQAMARCSCFAAHDAAAADNPPTPTVDELRADVEIAAAFAEARAKLNKQTEHRRRELVERPAALR